jgi:D-alanyl-D-alanine dipeptidase
MNNAVFRLLLLSTLCLSSCATRPPREKGVFKQPELVELAKLDTTFRLDIRYATANNFAGKQMYREAKAFLQRPAAEALVKVNEELRELGYGLMIFDGYRPWTVTKAFWDCTPKDKKQFVADPRKGSRHNRGCAVDLTLYDLATGKQVEMPGDYDEMSERSYFDYPGGTEAQRNARDLLRSKMEAHGFTVYKVEWWHFDYNDWKNYPIQNVSFHEISGQ